MQKLQLEWRERGYTMGLAQSRIDRAAGVGVEPRIPQVDTADHRWLEVAADPFDGSFSRADLIVARCVTLRAGATIDEVETHIRDALEHGALVRDSGVAGDRSGAGERFTTPARQIRTAEASERIGRLGRATGTVMLSYDEATGRVAVLDAAARLAAEVAERGRRVVAVSPGGRAALGFEAVSGIEALPVKRAGALAGLLSAGDAVVLADCGTMVEAELRSVMALCREAGAQPVLLGAEASIERSRLLGAVRAEAAHAEVEPLRAPAPALAPAPAPVDWRFGPAARAVAVPDASSARAEAVSRAGELAAAGREVMIVVPDWAVAADLRERTPSAVVYARRASAGLTARIGAAQPLPAVVVIGGAGVLEMTEDNLARLDRTHVVVSPDGEAGLGRVAEAVRPQHLTRVLGAVRSDPAMRAAWRQGAALIEDFRERYGLTGEPLAYGRRDRSPERQRDETLVRRRVTELAPALEPRVRGRERERAVPERGLGR